MESSLIKDQAVTVRPVSTPRVVEVVSVPPAATSLTDSVDFIDRPTLLGVLEPAMPADNTLSLGVVARGRDTLSLNTGARLERKEGALQARFTDDFSVTFRKLATPLALRAQVRGDRLWLHGDFDQHLFRFELGGARQRLWANPYLTLETSRALTKCTVGAGTLFHWDTIGLKKNFKFVFHQPQGAAGLQTDLVSKCSWKHRGFFLNGLWSVNMSNPLATTDREVLLGLEDREFVGAVSLRKSSPGSYLQWNLDRVAVQVAYNLRANGIVGAEVAHGLRPTDKPIVALGYQNRLSRDLFVKLRADTLGAISGFADFALGDGLSLQASAKTNPLRFENAKGFLELPLLFSAKLTIDR